MRYPEWESGVGLALVMRRLEETHATPRGGTYVDLGDSGDRVLSVVPAGAGNERVSVLMIHRDRKERRS